MLSAYTCSLVLEQVKALAAIAIALAAQAAVLVALAAFAVVAIALRH